MNTNVSFVFLLVIGLSAQMAIQRKSEFQVDFENMVKQTVSLGGNRTLLDCSENCDEVKETACKCIHFNHCMNSTVNCITTGLHMLNLKGSHTFRKRLKDLKITHEGTCQWHTLVSPRCFLNYILELYQKSKTIG